MNHATASHEHLDLIIGFQTGDLIWLGGSFRLIMLQPSKKLMVVDPFSLRYGRLNKQVRLSGGGGFPRLDEIDTYRRVAYQVRPARLYVGYHLLQTSSSYRTRTAQSLSMTRTATTVYLPHKSQLLPQCHPCAHHPALLFLLPSSHPRLLASGTHWTVSSSQYPHGTR